MDDVKRRANGASSIIIGIDPGSLITGFGVIAQKGGSFRLLASGTVRNSARASMPLRLQKIHAELCAVIDRYHPDECAIESAFYGKNAQSALKLGHARGVAILAAVERQIPTSEYSPREVKRAVVGNGAASKEQVQYMIKSIFRLSNGKMLHDTSDAIAIALCHLHSRSASIHPSPGKTLRQNSTWKSFVAAHPERVKP
jgi:crossover junction endodeoxyribonuclease RuvC